MEIVWEENEHEAARLALAKMIEELPHDYARESMFLGVPFYKLSRAELYVAIKYAGEMGNIVTGISQMERSVAQAKDDLFRRNRRPWWRFW